MAPMAGAQALATLDGAAALPPPRLDAVPGGAFLGPGAAFPPDAAARAGGITGTAREDLIVQIGVLSERAGDWARAREYFERYLADYPTNVRAFTIRQKLGKVTRQLAQEGGA